MHHDRAAELARAREQLVSFCARLIGDGLAVASAGNLSVRCGDLVAITPSGIGYDELRAADIAVTAMDGARPRVAGPRLPALAQLRRAPHAVGRRA